ncbi:MAG: ATP-binding protein [Myxococcota bacterium]|nr:ATP-binding protein [Myxococcota bacterium]
MRVPSLTPAIIVDVGASAVDEQSGIRQPEVAGWQAAQRLFDAVPASVAVMRGEQLVIEYVNASGVALWQRGTAAELLGRPLLEALPELHDQPAYVDLLRSVIHTGVPVSRSEAPVVLRGRDGHVTHYFDFTYSPVTNAEGVIDAVWVFAFDVTAVVLARREVELANRTKDEFLATLSHELRTPLNAMLGWASLLQKDSSDPARLARGLAVIERNAHAQAKIVGDLLDVSRILGGKLVLTVKPTQLAAVIAAALEPLHSAATSRGVKVTTELSTELTTIQADAHRLQQVLWNLLSNAVRFTPAGGEVRISTRAGAQSVVIEVTDTGSGIPAEHLPHVFERFRQVDGSLTRSHGGLGLGLSIVRYIVEAHGGTVSATSQGAGQGATFTIELPIGNEQAPESNAYGPVSVEALAAPPSVVIGSEPPAEPVTTGVFPTHLPLLGVRVLIVDDDEDCLEVLRLRLDAAGARVTAMRDAATALATAGPFDVIVSDIGMPGMDGYAFLRTLRAEPSSRASTPAIALTAYAHAEHVELARAAGYQEHVAKPCDIAQLVASIRRLALASGGAKRSAALLP